MKRATIGIYRIRKYFVNKNCRKIHELGIVRPFFLLVGLREIYHDNKYPATEISQTSI
jgi:hypothetical protein